MLHELVITMTDGHLRKRRGALEDLVELADKYLKTGKVVLVEIKNLNTYEVVISYAYDPDGAEDDDP